MQTQRARSEPATTGHNGVKSLDLRERESVSGERYGRTEVCRVPFLTRFIDVLHFLPSSRSMVIGSSKSPSLLEYTRRPPATPKKTPNTVGEPVSRGCPLGHWPPLARSRHAFHIERLCHQGVILHEQQVALRIRDVARVEPCD